MLRNDEELAREPGSKEREGCLRTNVVDRAKEKGRLGNISIEYTTFSVYLGSRKVMGRVVEHQLNAVGSCH